MQLKCAQRALVYNTLHTNVRQCELGTCLCVASRKLHAQMCRRLLFLYVMNSRRRMNQHLRTEHGKVYTILTL
jgi:hypothetical protein